jgi:Kinesin motor domain
MQASSAHQQAETRFINKSLNTFNTCLHTLWLNQQKNSSSAMVPVRSSALTRILSSAMNGRGHLALSVHFSLKEEDLEATRRTLDFAERAAQITVDARPKVRGKCLQNSFKGMWA